MDRLIATDGNNQDERGLSTGPATNSNSSLAHNGFVNNGTTADMDDDLSDSGIGKADVSISNFYSNETLLGTTNKYL